MKTLKANTPRQRSHKQADKTKTHQEKQKIWKKNLEAEIETRREEILRRDSHNLDVYHRVAITSRIMEN